VPVKLPLVVSMREGLRHPYCVYEGAIRSKPDNETWEEVLCLLQGLHLGVRSKDTGC
jgi:hypothetical protein